jgi:hypothetical protein
VASAQGWESLGFASGFHACALRGYTDVQMRIEFRDAQRRRIGRAEVDLSQRPTRITTTDTGQEMFLNWDGAVDDAGQLRRCISCGCADLFHEKIFPQVTGIVVVLAFAGALAGIGEFAGVGAFGEAFGPVTNIPVLTVMLIVLIADVGILLFARKRLICYRCRSRYHNLAIARYHRRWDRSVAERYPAPQQSPDDESGNERTDERAEAAMGTEAHRTPPSTTRLSRVLPDVSAMSGR